MFTYQGFFVDQNAMVLSNFFNQNSFSLPLRLRGWYLYHSVLSRELNMYGKFQFYRIKKVSKNSETNLEPEKHHINFAS